MTAGFLPKPRSDLEQQAEPRLGTTTMNETPETKPLAPATGSAPHPRSKIIYVTPEQYAAVEKEPVGPSGKLKPDRLAQLIGRDKMLRIMHASMHSLPVELRARKTPNNKLSHGGE